MMTHSLFSRRARSWLATVEHDQSIVRGRSPLLTDAQQHSIRFLRPMWRAGCLAMIVRAGGRPPKGEISMRVASQGLAFIGARTPKSTNAKIGVGQAFASAHARLT